MAFCNLFSKVLCKRSPSDVAESDDTESDDTECDDAESDGTESDDADAPFRISKGISARTMQYIKQKPIDLCIIVEDDMIPVHRSVLCDSSSYFQAMMKSNMTESLTGIAQIHHIRSDVVQTAINYLYGATIHVDMKDIIDFVDIVELWDLADVKSKLQEYINNHMGRTLQTDNCIRWYAFADSYNMNSVKRTVMEFIQKNESFDVYRYDYDIFATEEFQALSALQLDPLMRDIMGKRPELHVRNHVAMVACMKWTLSDVSTRKRYLNNLLTGITLQKCHPAYLKYILINHECLLDGKLHEKFIHTLSLSFLVIAYAGSKYSLMIYDTISSELRDIGDIHKNISLGGNEVNAFCMTDNGLFCVYGKWNVIHNDSNLHYKLFDCLTLEEHECLGHLICNHGNYWLNRIVAMGSKVFMVGGGKDEDQICSFDLLAKPTEWVNCAKMPQAMQVHRVLGSIAPYIFVATRNLKSGSLTFRSFDTVKGVWSIRTSPPISIVGTCAVAVNEDLYFAGGWGLVCVRYNTTDDTWTVLQGPHYSPCCIAAICGPRQIILVGDKLQLGDIQRPYSMQIYDTDSNKWVWSSIDHLELPYKIIFCGNF